MKSQDIGLLLKLICMQMREEGVYPVYQPGGWEDWSVADATEVKEPAGLYNIYTVRALAQSTGISKSQVNISLQRSIESGLARLDRKTQVPRANIKALYEFVVYGLRYVFPVKAGAVTRGISTALSAPVLQTDLHSVGDLPPVWPDANGNTKGQSIEPLFKSVGCAVQLDAELYALLALVDAIRIGQPRERNLAIKELGRRLAFSGNTSVPGSGNTKDQMVISDDLAISRKELNRLANIHHIKRLSLFGSAARGELESDSDIDLLIEFEESKQPTLAGMVRINDDFSTLFSGRQVDIATPSILNNPYRRREIEKDMEELYAA